MTMNPISQELWEKANREALHCLALSFPFPAEPEEQEPLRSLVRRFGSALKTGTPPDWTPRAERRLALLTRAVEEHPFLADTRMGNLTRSRAGLTACTFTKPDGGISAVFKGTGKGEWIDNGEGLSGIPEENDYVTYLAGGGELFTAAAQEDYATDQQAEALNWFHRTAAQNGWNADTPLTVSGHSKGGNKAQFVATHSDLPKLCFSFHGHGFSPEALTALERRYGARYQARRQHIHSFAAENDYVSVLGSQLVPEQHRYFLESRGGLHPIESILDEVGRLRPQREQGRLSVYAETVSKELMGLPPAVRQYATLGVMNIFQKYAGDGIPVNGDWVSAEKTVAGAAIAIGSLLRHLRKLQ